MAIRLFLALNTLQAEDDSRIGDDDIDIFAQRDTPVRAIPPSSTAEKTSSQKVVKPRSSKKVSCFL